MKIRGLNLWLVTVSGLTDRLWITTKSDMLGDAVKKADSFLRRIRRPGRVTDVENRGTLDA